MSKDSKQDEKNKKMSLLNDVISKIEKDFGKGSIMRLGEKPIKNIPAMSTGCLSLDYALGIGGIPKGRIIEIYGPEAGGKTTMALHIIAETQKNGGVVAFVDAEHALSIPYAKDLGVDTSSLLLSQPDYGEQALEIVDALVSSGAVDIVVVDSVTALVPKAEIEGDMGDPQMALQARLMSQALRKLTGTISKTNSCVIFINQLRSKIGVMFGPTETTTGGNALKFFASIRLDVRKINQIKTGNVVIGNKTKIKVVKNKVAPPFKEVEVDVIFGRGIDTIGDIIDLAIQFGIIGKSGAWYTYGEDRFQGKEQLSNALKADPIFIANLRSLVENYMITKDMSLPQAPISVDNEEDIPE